MGAGKTTVGEVCIAAALAAICCVSQAQSQMGWFRGAADGSSRIEASPLLVDLTHPPDGRLEIVVPSFDNRLYIYNHDGTTFSLGGQWPKLLGSGSEAFQDGTIASIATGKVVPNEPGLQIVVAGDNKMSQNATVKVFRTDGTQLASVLLNSLASAKATPCVVDCLRYLGVQQHGAEEIVIRDGDGRIHVLYWNGSGFSNLYDTLPLDTCTSDIQRDRWGSQPITPSVSAVFDENTSLTTLVVASTNNRVYRWQISSLPGSAPSSSGTADNWKVTSMSALETSSSDARFLGSPSLADLDGDGVLEIVAGTTRRQVYAWKNDSAGSLVQGWPRTTSQAVVSSPALADVDLDGRREVVIGCDDGKVYVWRHDGTMLQGWPQTALGAVFGSPVAAELDGNTGLEIVAGSLDGFLYAWDFAGRPLYGWPKRINSYGIYSSPAVGNIHRGERMSVVAASYEGRVFVFDLAPKSLDVTLGWQQFRGGAARLGVQRNP